VDDVRGVIATAGLLGVPAVATADNEIDPQMLAYGLPVEASAMSISPTPRARSRQASASAAPRTASPISSCRWPSTPWRWWSTRPMTGSPA
jgi:hypothetical protein